LPPSHCPCADRLATIMRSCVNMLRMSPSSLGFRGMVQQGPEISAAQAGGKAQVSEPHWEQRLIFGTRITQQTKPKPLGADRVSTRSTTVLY
jgi:hypothetical protein